MSQGFSIILVYVVLFVASCFYNKLVSHLEKNGLLDGLKAILVVGGVIYTLVLVSPIVGSEASLIVAGGFVFSLAPMVWGDISRNLEARKGEINFWQQLMKTRRDD